MRAVTVVAFAVSALCAACTSVPSKDEVDAKHAEMASNLVQRNSEIVSVPQDRELVTRAKGAWLGVKVKPLAQDVTLPAMFRMPVTMNYPGRFDLRTIAEKITKTTGVPVTLKPDVFMPISAFVGGGAGGAESAPSGARGGEVEVNKDDMVLNFIDVPLKDVINQVNSRFGVNATYTDNEGLTFSRFVTRTINVKANPGDSTLTASLGKGGSSGGSGGSGGAAGGGGGAAFTSDGKVSMESKFSVWTAIEGALNTIKSPPGKFIINQATGSVTITDTKEIVDIAQRYIEGENAIMTRQVAVRVELLSVTSNDNKELGVNWNGVFTKLSGLIPQWNVKLVTPGSLNSSMVGGLGMSILAPPRDGSTLSMLNGTEAMLNALQGYARITNRQSFAAMTLNRQPAPIAKTIQETYLARTTPGGNAGQGSSTLPGLEPGQVTTGFMSNILPTVLDNDTVMLQFSIDSSQLERLDSISTGSGETLQRIQTPKVGAVQTVQRVALRSGGTLVLTGFDREVMQYDQRGLTNHVGLGGSYNGSKIRETYVILVTPIIVDGA
jgi:type IVB pilus formation R64 PilN family outer membrane protein